MTKASETAHLLWPHLLPLIRRAVNGNGNGGGGSSGVGGTTTAHALNSGLHTGTIGNTQAPQFLLRDGTRSLQGDLSVDAGVQIDGVDLSVHVLDPNAHHLAASAGDGISVSVGQQVSVNAPANSGLTFIAGQVFVKIYDGLGRDNNGVWVKRASPNSGLAIDGSAALTLGIPSTITPTSVNAVSGVSHGHDADSSSDVGNTPASKLLHSTSTGGLTLGSLVVRGGLDIVNYGDLTVGNNVLFVMNLPDETSGANNSRVGIMRSPDPQFALDVNGPIRGTELVGKHAIQLDDVALLLHFDGGQPYETNFAGEPNAVPLGQVPSFNENTRYRPGKFYKNVVLGRTRINRILNPSFEVDTSGWTFQNTGGSGDYFAREISDSYFGLACARLGWGIPGHQIYNVPIPFANGNAYSFGVWLRANIPTVVYIGFELDGSPYTTYGRIAVNVTEEWQFYSTAGTPPLNAPVRARIDVQSGATANNSLYVDGTQVEAAPTASWYIDGTLGPGYVWNGTAHASTSTRTQTRLEYSLVNMVEHRWTVMGYFALPYKTSSSNSGILRMTIGGSQEINFYSTAPGGIFGFVNHNGGASFPAFALMDIVPGQYYHLAMTYTPGQLRAYLDGVNVFTLSVTFTGAPSVVQLGNMTGGSYGDVMVDDLCVSRQCLTTNRVKAIYASDAPVFATSSVFSFRATPKGLVWADEEGLWMRDVDGDAVFGIYGGDAATKSWAGLNMTSGDLVIGNASSSYLFWDNDLVSATKLRIFNAHLEMESGSNLLSLDPATGLIMETDYGYTPINVSNPFPSITFNLLNATHVRSNGFLSLLLGEGSGKHQGILAVANSFSPDATELVLQAQTYEATSDALDAQVILQARAWGVTNDALPGPYDRDTRLTVSAANGFTLNKATTVQGALTVTGALTLSGVSTSASAVGAYAGKMQIRIGGTLRWIEFFAS